MINYLEELQSSLSNDSYKLCEAGHNTLVLCVDTDRLRDVIKFMHGNTGFNCKVLIDIFAVDYPHKEQRFEVIYNLLSLSRNLRVIVKVPVHEDEAVPSVVDIYAGALWFERETWDMYGIQFSNNPDLRRLLTDYGFEGHPLRKDFPLTGYVEVRYDIEQKKVVYEPVRLMQEFRNFDFLSPWEGTDYVLPGDEKAKSDGAR